ncbi:septum formation inhibitor Maf [Tessaracoccus rhinocerotis]|uniref:Nucleoside triphosphate pyrophosphatase n=1 Tax=Tessaracoccus rhinocerotis TaxID=1689449 RepID=A0A553K524_9ACTN|nr:nucleoside triphosphate pyrophosphatase [Tessaracoccus rhinocerotis]TRY19791.1 septum formation inhibitor Maf [Tessaracoccus rhinocerotis]
MNTPRFILASRSPGRLRLLRQAGLDPEVLVSGFDESQVIETDSARLALALAEAKGTSVLDQVEGDAILVACDSVLEFEGRPRGKPGTPASAAEQWRRMRGRQGVLHTGHYVWVRRGDEEVSTKRVGSTVVKFADLADDEIHAYTHSGEPLWVAGSFTIDGLGGAYLTGIEGDPHNVVGISLPLMRQMLLDLGIVWHELWRPDAVGH